MRAQAFSIALGLVLALAVAACGGDSTPPVPTPEPTPPPAGSGPPEQALAKHIETTYSKQYVEDCSKAQAGTDAGKFCSTFRGEREKQRAYIIGPVFSEPAGWVILEERNGQWNVVSTQMVSADNVAVVGVPWPLKVGVDLIVTGADPCLNVREGPALNQKAVDCIKNDTKIQLASGPASGDNIQWWQVAGRSGWVAADYLRYPDARQ